MKTTFTLLALLSFLLLRDGFSSAAESAVQGDTVAKSAETVPEAGPENGGMRLRLFVTPRADSDKENADNGNSGKQRYDVRIELINVSHDDIKLRAAWNSDDPGSVQDYLDAATSIETYPAIAPWIGGVGMGHRQGPQPERMLKAGETLSVHWQTTGKHLKNRVTNPNQVQNPEFPMSGLYSVHATLVAPLHVGGVLLRSNEALVPVGNSRELPKATYGQLWGVTDDGKTGTLSLGTLNKVERGDQFTHFSKLGSWKLTITEAFPDYSVGLIEPTPFPGAPVKPIIQPPQRGDSVSLMLKD